MPEFKSVTSILWALGCESVIASFVAKQEGKQEIIYQKDVGTKKI